jgi:hypothetical protein
MIKKAYAVILIIFALAFCCSNGFLQNSYSPLIHQNEKVLFGFKAEKSGKIVTVAIHTANPDYIVYRFGLKDKIELEFPLHKENSWEEFTYSYYFRGGGAGNLGMDLNYLTFVNGNYTYTIYSEYYSEDETTKVGVKMKDNLSNKEFNINGDPQSIVGSLIDLRDDERIKTKEME